MKRIALITALLGAVVLAFAGIAMADSGVGTTPGGGTGGASGNGTQVSHYTATYTDAVFGPVSCVGVYQVKKNQPVQESFTCTSTSGSPLTGYSAGQAFTLAAGAWWSDWNYWTQGGKIVPDTAFNGTVSADGMSYSAVATY